MDKAITIRYDEGMRQFVLTLVIEGVGTFEGYGRILSEALHDLTERLEDQGI